MCIKGGYKTQTIIQLANLISAFDANRISLKAFKLYFACLVIVSAREAAKRSKPRAKRQGKVTPRYLTKELSKLTGYPLARIRGELRALEAAKLIHFCESEITFTETPTLESHQLKDLLAGSRSAARPIPLPRPLLRFLAKSSKASTIKTALAYCARGLSISRRAEITGKGSVKATWIAQALGLSERSVRAARSDLLEFGFITDDEGSFQRKLNRDGAYFTINLSWNGKTDSKRVIHREGSEGAIKSPVAERVPVDNSFVADPYFAPPGAQNCSNFAPPYKDKKTPYGSKDQKTLSAAQKPTGVFKNGGEGKPPSIRDVTFDDLKSFGRVEKLFFQAVKTGLIDGTEVSAINFIGAAARALNVQGDSPRVFMGIVRKRLWHHISQADEDRALRALRRYREDDPDRFRVPNGVRLAA